MEQSFSQRMGFQPVKQIIQVSSIDDDLRTAIWNDFYKYIWTNNLWTTAYTVYNYITEMWTSYFHKAVDEVPDLGVFLLHIRQYFFECEWHNVYDFIEVTINIIPISFEVGENFIKACNATLTRELSGYRFIDKLIVPITSTQEVAEVEEAIHISQGFTPHLVRALTFLADRQSPDYRNSIKESISAVEAMCQLIVGDQNVTLGKALARLESKIGKYPHSLRNALTQLYDFTSDAQGIRHALLGESNLDIEDARFMLIPCSTFINYLAAKAAKAGIELSQIQEVAQ